MSFSREDNLYFLLKPRGLPLFFFSRGAFEFSIEGESANESATNTEVGPAFNLNPSEPYFLGPLFYFVSSLNEPQVEPIVLVNPLRSTSWGCFYIER